MTCASDSWRLLYPTLQIVPVNRVLSVNRGPGPLQRTFGCASVHFGTVPGPVRTS